MFIFNQQNVLNLPNSDMITVRVDKRRKSSRFHFSSAAMAAAPQRFFCPQNVMVSTSSCFRLPIGSHRQNFFLEAERFGGRRQSGGGSHWRPPPEDNLKAR